MGVRIQELPETTGIKKEDVLIVEDGQGTKKGTVQQLDEALGVSQLKEELVNQRMNITQSDDLTKIVSNYTWKDNYYVDFSNGTEYPLKDYSHTDYIYLNANTEYVIRNITYLHICKYNLNLNFINGIKETSGKIVTIKTTEPIFIICSIKTDKKNSLIIENVTAKNLLKSFDLNSVIKNVIMDKSTKTNFRGVNYSFDENKDKYLISRIEENTNIGSYYNFISLVNTLREFEIGKEYYIQITNPNPNIKVQVFYTEQEIADGYVNIGNSSTSFKLSIPNNQNIKGLLFRFYVEEGTELFESEVGINICTEYPNSYIDELENKIEYFHEISILFVGNSLTQDAISYLPYLLRTYYPNIKFKFYMWYVGGKNLDEQYQYFVNNTNCDIFSISENSIKWTNTEMNMKDILKTYTFDIVCMQEYFNYKTSFTLENLSGWNNCQNFIRENYTGVNSLKFVELFHAPKRDNATNIFEITKIGNGVIMKNTICEDIIPVGIAIYNALSTSLDNLGDSGHLSPDGTHAQEGLPCLMQSLVALLWLLKEVGINNKSIYNCKARMTNDIYNSLNVPGANLGSGVITGTDDENILSQEVAIKSFKEGQKLVIESI